jgi:SAM-dependent methyltransferase
MGLVASVPDLRAIEGFDAGEIFDQGRPPLPADAVAALVAALGINPTSTVLDFCAGTGKFTAGLVPLIREVIAVDPSASMLSVLRRRLPAVDARLGSAERIPLQLDPMEDRPSVCRRGRHSPRRLRGKSSR